MKSGYMQEWHTGTDPLGDKGVSIYLIPEAIVYVFYHNLI